MNTRACIAIVVQTKEIHTNANKVVVKVMMVAAVSSIVREVEMAHTVVGRKAP